jgi:hypothetical protein
VLNGRVAWMGLMIVGLMRIGLIKDGISRIVRCKMMRSSDDGELRLLRVSL